MAKIVKMKVEVEVIGPLPKLFDVHSLNDLIRKIYDGEVYAEAEISNLCELDEGDAISTAAFPWMKDNGKVENA